MGLLLVNGQQYIRPNQQFWAMVGDAKQAPAIAKLTGREWVKVPDKEKVRGDG